LALTGPPGTGKTATVRVLAREMGFQILEWRSAIGESTFSKFKVFFDRATSCSAVCPETSLTAATPSLYSTLNRRESDLPPTSLKHVVLFEDLPNILHAGIQAQFHTAIRLYIESASPVPLVIIMSDTTMRGETRDEQLTGGRSTSGYAWSRERSDILDIRTVLSRDLLTGPYVTQIGCVYILFILMINEWIHRFNPIAPTLMKKALTRLLHRHFISKSSSSSVFVPPSKEMISMVVESANGDIRSAIMTLQFSCIPGKKSPRRKGDPCSTAPIQVVTRRESGLALFHLIGRVMYNKRLSSGLYMNI